MERKKGEKALASMTSGHQAPSILFLEDTPYDGENLRRPDTESKAQASTRGMCICGEHIRRFQASIVLLLMYRLAFT